MNHHSAKEMFKSSEEEYPDIRNEQFNNEINSSLKLGVTRTWGNRTIQTNSNKWKKMKEVVLKRDNFQCRFCGIRLGKFFVLDHMDGRADHNAFSNLGLNCPSCDKIRHCGFYGMNGEVILRQSLLSQQEIVQQTHAYIRDHKRIPSPEEIDQNCKIPHNFVISTRNGNPITELKHPDLGSEYTTVIAANVLLQYNYSDLAIEFQSLKGFFRSVDSFKFLEFEI
jgi:hypothetical protein